jgi:glutamate-1-semialdehyde 2,1-aminomutase
MSGLNPAGVPRGLAETAFPFRYNHAEELEEIITAQGGEIAAIVMEPIRNREPAPGFLESVRSLSKETGAVLIVDEISAGFRMNSGGAHLLLGMVPDMAVFSKALGNGYPIGAIIGTEEVMGAAQETFISSTMWTERVGPTAALATIGKHRAVDAGRHLMDVGRQVQRGWESRGNKHGLSIEVSGIPPLSHFSFQYDNAAALKALFVQLMLERGFLASNLFYAMYAHGAEHVESYLEAVDASFGEMADAVEKGQVEKRLRGKPTYQGFQRLT